MVGYNKHHLAQGTREGKDPETLKKTVRGTGRKQGALGTVASNAVSGKRLGEEEQQKNKDAMLAKPEDLMFMSPLLEGYALKNKIWGKCPKILRLPLFHEANLSMYSLILCGGYPTDGLER